jgi:hypothetical protein
MPVRERNGGNKLLCENMFKELDVKENSHVFTYAFSCLVLARASSCWQSLAPDPF